MVQIASEDNLVRLQRNSPFEIVTPEGLKMRGLVQRARIEIPLIDPVRLRETADILRGLANSLDQTSRNTNVDPYTALLSALLDCRAAQQKINRPHKIR